MAGKGNRIKEPIVKDDVEMEEELVTEKPQKKVRQRKEKVSVDETHAVKLFLTN